MEKYLSRDPASLEAMLAACKDFKERQHIRSALREIKGLKHSANQVTTYSFGSETVKHLEGTKSKIGERRDNLIKDFKETSVCNKKEQEINGKHYSHVISSSSTANKDNAKEEANNKGYICVSNLGKPNIEIESTNTIFGCLNEVLPESKCQHSVSMSDVGLYIAKKVNVLKTHNQNNQDNNGNISNNITPGSKLCTHHSVNKFKKVQIYRVYNIQKPDSLEEPNTTQKENLVKTDGLQNTAFIDKNSFVIKENSPQGKTENCSKFCRSNKVKSRAASLNLSNLNTGEGLINSSKGNVISSPGNSLHPSSNNVSPRKQTTTSPKTPGAYSPRKPRKIVSYRSCAFSPQSKLSSISSTVSRSKLQSAPATYYQTLDFDCETQNVHASNLKDCIENCRDLESMKGENSNLEGGHDIILSPIETNCDVTTIQEKMDTNEVFQSPDSADTFSDCIIKVSDNKKKATIFRRNRIDSDEKKIYKKYRRKSKERDDINETGINNVSNDKTETDSGQVQIATSSSVICQQLPQTFIKDKNDAEDDETIHEQTIRLLQERKYERQQRLAHEKESDNKPKKSPADLKRSLEKKLECSDSKRKAYRIRRELQLLNRENEQKLANNVNKSDDEIVVQNHDLTVGKENIRKYIQSSKSDIGKIQKQESVNDFIIGIDAHDQKNAIDETECGLININLSTQEKINIIGTLMQEEAKLQDMLRKSAIFNEKRRMRGQIRQLRQKRTALEGEGALENAATFNRSSSVVAQASPSDIQYSLDKQGDDNVTQSNLTELRRKLSETQNYDEKKKIRLALRQLRQQNRDDVSHLPTSLQRSQSFIQQKSSEPVKVSSTQLKEQPVIRSHSVAELFSRDNSCKDFLPLTNGEIAGIDRNLEKHSSLKSANSQPLILHTNSQKRNSLNDTEIDIAVAYIPQSSTKKDTGISNDTRKYFGVNEEISRKHSSVINSHISIKEREDGLKARENIIRDRDRKTKSTYQKLRPSENKDFNIDRILPFTEENELAHTIKDSNENTRVHYQYRPVEYSEDTTQKLETQNRNCVLDRCQLFEVVSKDHATLVKTKYPHVVVSTAKVDRKKAENDSFVRTLKSDNHIKTGVDESEFLDNRISLKDSSENFEFEIPSYLAKSDNELDINNERLSPSLHWLEEKRKSVIYPNEDEQLKSTMDIEAAFSQILHAVDKFPEGRENSIAHAADIPILEEDSTEFVLLNELVNVENISSDTDSSVKTDNTGDTVITIKKDKGNSRFKCDKDLDDSNVLKEKQSAILEASRNTDTNADDQKPISSSMNMFTNAGKNNGAISVIRGNDGAVIFQEVCHFQEGETTITTSKKLQRTGSKTDTCETDRVTEKNVTLPDGSTTVYERDVLKTTHKLTSRGSNYFTQNKYNIKKMRDPDGMEIVQHELNSLSENMSVTKNKSWSDVSVAKVMLTCQPSDDSQEILKPVDDCNQLGTQCVNEKRSKNSPSTSVAQNSPDMTNSKTIFQSHIGRPFGCPEITSPLKEVHSIEGSLVILECSVISSPLPRVKWYKGDADVTERADVKLLFNEATGKATLTIQNASAEDSGRYRCSFENAAGAASTQCLLLVIENSDRLPSFVTQLHDITVCEGQVLELKCHVKDTNCVRWYKDGMILKNDADFKQTFEGSLAKLEIVKVYLDDCGTYTCTVRNENGEKQNSCKITVTESKSLKEVVPVFLMKPENQIADEFDTVIIESEVIGSPKPDITWYCNKLKITEDGHYRMLYDGRIAMLVVRKVTLKDSGKIECHAENTSGRVSADCSLIVQVAKAMPSISQPLSDITVDSGEVAVLECGVQGVSQENIVWRKNGLIIGQMFDFQQPYADGIARLEISKVSQQDSGIYKCVANNENREARTSGQLTVKDEVHSVSTLTATVHAVPTPTATVHAVPTLTATVQAVPTLTATVHAVPPLTTTVHAVPTLTEKVHAVPTLTTTVLAVPTLTTTVLAVPTLTTTVLAVPKLINVDALPIQATNKEANTVAVQVLTAKYVPKQDTENQPASECQASKIMPIRQASLRSLERKNLEQPLQRSGSLQCMMPQKTEKLIKSNDIVHSKTGKQDVKMLNNIRPNEKLSKLVSEVESQPTYNKELRHMANEIVQSAETKAIDTSDNLKRLVDHNENITIDMKAVSDKHVFSQNEWKPSTKLYSVKDNIKGTATELYSKALFLDSRPASETKSTSLCLETPVDQEVMPATKVKVGTEIRRTQSVRTSGIEKPEWLQMKLRKISENKSSPLASKASEIGPSTPSSKALEKTKPEMDKVISDAFEMCPNSVHNETKLTKNRFSSQNNQPASLALKDSTNSPVNHSNGDSPKLTPVTERAKLFQSNDTSSASGKSSSAEIIAKAIKLNHTESLHAFLESRASSSVNHSQSFKTISSSGHHKGDITLDLSPKLSLGHKQKKDSGFNSKIKYWDPTSSSDTKMDYSKIQDEEELNKLLSSSDNFDERKKIRARIKELRDQHTKEWEAKRQSREKESEDLIKKKHREADLLKQQKLEGFKKQAAEHHEAKHLDMAEQHLKEKHKLAEEEKKRTLQEYQSRGAVHEDQKHLEISERALQEKIKQADILKLKQLDMYDQVAKKEDGKTTKVEPVLKPSGSAGKPAEEIAPELVQQFINATNIISGILTVKTESWNNKDGITHRAEKTESWGGKTSAMNQFKQMDATAAKTNPLVAYTFAKKAATTMKRNAVTIKQDVLAFCKANTAEYETIDIQNFSSSWNDGIAFCALIHHFYPEAFDFNSLNPKERRKNFELAFNTAEKYADIAPLLDVEDMVRMQKPDWKCVFTYVQSFYRKLRDHDNNKVKGAE